MEQMCLRSCYVTCLEAHLGCQLAYRWLLPSHLNVHLKINRQHNCQLILLSHSADVQTVLWPSKYHYLRWQLNRLIFHVTLIEFVCASISGFGQAGRQWPRDPYVLAHHRHSLVPRSVIFTRQINSIDLIVVFRTSSSYSAAPPRIYSNPEWSVHSILGRLHLNTNEGGFPKTQPRPQARQEGGAERAPGQEYMFRVGVRDWELIGFPLQLNHVHPSNHSSLPSSADSITGLRT